MDKFKDEELEFLAREEKVANQELDDLGPESEIKLNNPINQRASVFANVKPITNIEKKIDNDLDDFNPEDYLDKKAFKRMSIGLWLSENKKNINKVIVVLLILISATFFIYSLYNLVIYLKAGNPAEGLVDNNLSRSPDQVKPLIFSQVKVFPNNLKNDLAILVNNNNPRFYANFDYCFKKGDVEISCGQNFILPNSEKYILDFGIETSSIEGNFSFSISKIAWKRVSREIVDYQNFQDERLNFEIYNINFKPSASVVSANIDLNSLAFSFENASSYSYYEVPLNILLFDGDELKGINRYIINNFYTGEMRRVNLTWASDLRQAKRTLILPELNIFDENIFLKYRGN